MISKEIKKEYGHRISQALNTSPAHIQKAFSFREKIEIAVGLKSCAAEYTKFKQNLEKAIYAEVIEGLSWAPVYMERRDGDKFVRCVRVQGKVKSYVKVEQKDLAEIKGSIYIRQDDSDDAVYAEISEDARK